MSKRHWLHEEEILQYLDGSLDTPYRDERTEHLSACNDCRERMLLEKRRLRDAADEAARTLDRVALPDDGIARFQAIRRAADLREGHGIADEVEESIGARLVRWLSFGRGTPGLAGAFGALAVVVFALVLRPGGENESDGLRSRVIDGLPPAIGESLRVPLEGRIERFAVRATSNDEEERALVDLALELETRQTEDPNDGETSLLLGHIEQALGRFDSAATEYRRARNGNLSPTSRLEADLGLASVLARTGDPAAALDVLPPSSEDPTFGPAIDFNRVALLVQSGRRDEAIDRGHRYVERWGADRWISNLLPEVLSSDED